MLLTDEQLKTYAEQGFLFLPSCFSQAEVDVIKANLPEVLAKDLPGKVLEKDQSNVRMVHGVHKEEETFDRLSRHPRIVEPVKQILNSDVYIHQFKVNAKVAFDGDAWQWHQDYIYLWKEDGIPTARMANAIVFLDEVNEFNGPLLLIPGSQNEGIVSILTEEKQHQSYGDSPSWIVHMTTKLKYTIEPDVLTRLVSQYGIVAPKGPAGSVLLFHPNCVHGSASNMSPFDRTIVVINFNSVENLPVAVESPRPEFLASHDYSPVKLTSEEGLLELLK